MNHWTLDDLDALAARVAMLEAVIKPPPSAALAIYDAGGSRDEMAAALRGGR